MYIPIVYSETTFGGDIMRSQLVTNPNITWTRHEISWVLPSALDLTTRSQKWGFRYFQRCPGSVCASPSVGRYPTSSSFKSDFYEIPEFSWVSCLLPSCSELQTYPVNLHWVFVNSAPFWLWLLCATRTPLPATATACAVNSKSLCISDSESKSTIDLTCCISKYFGFKDA